MLPVNTAALPLLALNPPLHPVCFAQELPEPQLDAETRAAFDLAYENIAAFHRAQQVGGQGQGTVNMPMLSCSTTGL